MRINYPVAVTVRLSEHYSSKMLKKSGRKQSVTVAVQLVLSNSD